MKKFGKVLLIILGTCLTLFLLAGLVNFGCNLALRHYIHSFDMPATKNVEKLEPAIEDGHYTFTTDEDFNIMHLTDIHLGGGFWTYKKDKKTIYEVLTMVKADQPDLIILGGDNVFAVPGPMYNGGFTLNNKMVERTVIEMFEQAGVYYSTVFGNHDTESFDYFSRQSVGNLFMKDKFKYCIFTEEFTDSDADTVPSVSNQFIVLKGTDGNIRKLIMLIDTNAYVDTSIQASIDWNYDIIHGAQIDWAHDTIVELSAKEGLPEGEYLKTLTFLHIPVGEFQTAYNQLIDDVEADDGISFAPREDTLDTSFVSGYWDEEKVCYGGYTKPCEPEDADSFFEVMHDELDSIEAIFCGHDHVNNSVVYYKGVMLSYGYSLDNIAYTDIANVGSQRGSTIITVHADNSFSQVHKNLYRDYDCDPHKFVDTDAEGVYSPTLFRTIE